MSNKIFISTTGTIVSLYSDQFDIRKLGNTIVKRIAYVEPENNYWTFKLKMAPNHQNSSPIFWKRTDALEAEKLAVTNSLRNDIQPYIELKNKTLKTTLTEE